MSLVPSESEFSELAKQCIENKSVNFIGQKTHKELVTSYSGTGIVICAGGMKYGTNAYINIRHMIDTLQTKLPIELWYVGKDEYINKIFDDLKDRYNKQISFVDAKTILRQYPYKGKLTWYPIKPYAMMYSKFETILFLDADCILYQQPEKILNTNLFKEHEALFCSDIDLFHAKSGRLHEKDKNYRVPRLGIWNQHSSKWIYNQKNPLWDILEIEEDDLPEFESGLICLNKTKHIEALSFALFLNENHDFIYNYICGDKDTFKLAWAKFGSKLNLINDVRPNILHNRFIEGYLDNDLLYQHRVNDAKFDCKKTWGEFPNSLSCQSMHIIKDLFEELTEKIGNDSFDQTFKHSIPISELMPGSKKENAELYINFVNNLVLDKNIKSILEIGCADGLMLSNLDLPETTKVTGIDVSDTAIALCKLKFSHQDNYSFIKADAKNYDKYNVDLVLIKDVFQHLSYKDIYQILELAEKSKYVVVVNDVPSENKDINRGSYRAIDITDIYHKKCSEYHQYGNTYDTRKNIVLYQNNEVL